MRHVKTRRSQESTALVRVHWRPSQKYSWLLVYVVTSWVSLESLYRGSAKLSHLISSEMNLNIYSVGFQILPSCPDYELWERGKGRRRRRNKDAITVQGNLYGHQASYDLLNSPTDVDIMALRLFGPPPRNTTYACIWEIDVGAIKGSITPQEAQGIYLAVSSFSLSFEDELNAPAEDLVTPVDPDGNGSSKSTCFD